MKNRVHLATNLGRGGISILILSGSEELLHQADHAIERLNNRTELIAVGELIFGLIRSNAKGEVIDEVVASAPDKNSRIISGHGGSASAIALLEFYKNLGFSETASSLLPADSASNEEETLQELLPHARTETQAYYCLKAIEQLRNGEPAATERVISLFKPRIILLAGAPNAGKSSLLNSICGYERVMVSSIEGTTRDAVKDYVNIGGYYCHIIDTAGFRAETGRTEEEAIKRGRQLLTSADVILLVLDSSQNLTADDSIAITEVLSHKGKEVIPVLNKSDLPNKLDLSESPLAEKTNNTVRLSCKTRVGLDELIKQITLKLA